MTERVKEYKTIWNDDAVEDLTRLWDEGHSAKAIAEALGPGVTRCAVIGKAKRLKLPLREQGVNPLRREIAQSGRLVLPAPRRVPRMKRPLSSSITVIRPHQELKIIKRQPEMTKSQLRAELAQAVRNTAAMPVE